MMTDLLPRFLHQHIHDDSQQSRMESRPDDHSEIVYEVANLEHFDLLTMDPVGNILPIRDVWIQGNHPILWQQT